MNRRIVTYILFCTVAVYGMGLPQFVHYLVDHQGWGWGGAAAVSHHGCCSASCHLAIADESETLEGEHEGHCDDAHDCDVCTMLATSFAGAPNVVALKMLYGPTPSCAAPVHASACLSFRAGPHSPRGPPAHI